MIKKTLQYIPGVLIPLIINFVLTFLYAMFLEPGQYGILNVYLNTIQLVYALTLSLFQTSSLRFYSLEETYEDETVFVSTYLFANLYITIGIIPFALIVNLFFKFNWQIIIVSIGAYGVYQFLCNIYRLKNFSGKYNRARCVVSVLTIVSLLLLSKILSPLSYIGPLICVYGSYGLVAIIELYLIRSKINPGRVSLNLLKESFKYGVPLIGVTVLGYIVANSDQYFLLYFLGDVAVGNYSLGYRLVDSLEVNLLMIILLVMTPELNRQHDIAGAEVSRLTLRNMMNATIWTILPISFAIIMYADYIIRFVFPEYSSAAIIMRLVVFASIFHGISMIICKGLELVKETRYVFYSLFIAAIINIVYNAIFIPVYGINASAHSSIIAYFVYNIFLVLFTKRFYSILIDWKYISKCSLLTGITCAVAYIQERFWTIGSIYVLIMEVFICMLVYMLGSYLLHLFEALR